MKRSKDRSGKIHVALVSSLVTLVTCGGRTPLLDFPGNTSADARAAGADAATDSDSALSGDASDGSRDSGRDAGLTIGSYAIATATCSPNDAGAVSVMIGVDRLSCDSEPSGSYVRVSLWYTGWDYLKPGRYAVDVNGGNGMSLYSPKPGSTDWEGGTNTILTIKTIDSEGMLGHVEASFPSGTVSMDFTAKWCAGNPMCG